MMDTLHKDGKCERMPVLLSGVEGFKLLGVPYLSETKDMMGNKIANVVLPLLHQWNCTNNIVGMVFDTTSSNTGHKSGACIAIQRDLNKCLLWFACRHHVCEVISSNVWKELDVEPLKSPNFTIFSKFKSNWNRIVNVLNNSSDMYLNTVQHDENILLLFKSFSEESYPRNDYKELIELSIVFLGGSDVTKYKFKRPGALDKCRWMAKFFKY